MKSYSARRLVPTCIIAAGAVAALGAPGVASAETAEQCSGVSVTGQGSSLQKLAQQNVWNPGFNTSGVKSACSGKQGSKDKPTVTYSSTGSGGGLKSWGAESSEKNPFVGFAATNAYIGTDEPPNASQKAEIEARGSGASETLQTIPVLQGSVAVVVHLPASCTATSKAFPGRLVLGNAALEKIFRGTISKWSQLTEDGDTLEGAGCNAEEAIKRVVRLDQSGTTHIFKKYLSLINASPFEDEEGHEVTWTQASEGALNTQWPKAAAVLRGASSGGGALLAKVASEASSIGYANLADARANSTFIPPTGGSKTATFWAPLENAPSKGTGVAKYADPSTDADTAKVANANCAATVYTNGDGVSFPPASTSAVWNEVTTKTTEKKYTLCGLTYDLAFSAYSKFPGTSLLEATTVNNFLRFVTESAGGQKLIANRDYLGLPKGSVLTEAQAGTASVGF